MWFFKIIKEIKILLKNVIMCSGICTFIKGKSCIREQRRNTFTQLKELILFGSDSVLDQFYFIL